MDAASQMERCHELFAQVRSRYMKKLIKSFWRDCENFVRWLVNQIVLKYFDA